MPKNREEGGRMKPMTVSLAAGITAAIVSLLCALLLAITPFGWSTAYAMSLMHSVSSSAFVRPVFLFTNVILGAIYAFITAFVIAWIFAAAYNWVRKSVKE